MMYVAHAKGLFMLEGCDKDRAHMPRRARWRWHGPPKCPDSCAGCAAGMPPFHWYTDSESQVIDLAHLVATTPGEPALEFGEDGLRARVAKAVGEREGQGDWLAQLEDRS